MYGRLNWPKATRKTFRRHFPIWFSINLRPSNPVAYLRLGDTVHSWVLDTLWSFHLGLCQSNLRGSNRRQRAASALGRRLG